MIRTQIQLTEEQSGRLKQLAAQEGVSIAELIRRSVDQYVRSEPYIDREERKRRALSVVGKYSFGVDDVSQRHDDYLAEAYAEVGK